jgi:hypothetical protein
MISLYTFNWIDIMKNLMIFYQLKLSILEVWLVDFIFTNIKKYPYNHQISIIN